MVGWQALRVRWIAAGLPASSPEVSDNDQAMEEASDDELAPPPASVHAGFTMEQVQMHFNAVMAEELPALPLSVFR